MTGLRRYAEAEVLLLDALEGLEAAEGFKGFLTTTGDRLVNLYEAWGRVDRADEARTRFSVPQPPEKE